MRLLLSATMLLLMGCEQNGRYQMVSGSSVWPVIRMDTKTGELSGCGPEAFANPPRVHCVSYPDTIAKK